MTIKRKATILLISAFLSSLSPSAKARRNHLSHHTALETLMAAGLLTLFLTDGRRRFSGILGRQHEPVRTVVVPVPVHGLGSRVVRPVHTVTPRLLDSMPEHNLFHPYQNAISGRLALDQGMNFGGLDYSLALNELQGTGVSDLRNIGGGYSMGDFGSIGNEFTFGDINSARLSFAGLENEVSGMPYHSLAENLLLRHLI